MKQKVVRGKLDRNRSGFGFLIRDDGVKPDIYIKRKNHRSAMDNDIVDVEIISHPKSPKPEGRILRIVKRASKEIVGTVRKRKGRLSFFPLGSADRINVSKGGECSGVRDGDRVILKLEKMPSGNKNALGSIIRIIGPAGTYKTEAEVTLIHSGIRQEFPPDVLKEASGVSSQVEYSPEDSREDLRGLRCFTIDPKRAKDFDDAVSIEILKQGYRLGVHIADVSHFVREGSAIDREAFRRGTSVYLLDRVIPMLPETLSNGICSLKPGADRFALSVLIDLDTSGNIKGKRFLKSIIKSRRRFSYSEVDAVLEGRKEVKKELGRDIREMARLAGILRKKRQKRGAIDFDFPELKIYLKKDGTVKHIKRVPRTDSHRLIEEFMILANEAVASRTASGKLPSLYRVHEKPSAEKMKAFRDFVGLFGFRIPDRAGITPRDLQDILNRIKESREEVVISTMMLRSLQQAVYSDVNKGHFALASEAYTHFTSPIRRYPDLIVHRVVSDLAVRGTLKESRSELYRKKLGRWSVKLSEKERSADEAETETRELKIMEHMKERVGDVFNGIVSGVTGFGIFVELETGLEGLIRIKELKDDYYGFVESEMILRGRRTRKEFRPGDKIKVKLVRIDMEKREVDFLPE